MKFKVIFKRLILVLLSSLIILGIGYFAALFISHRTGNNMQDAMSIVGIIIFIIGILMSMKGSPSGTGFNGLGQKNVTQIQYHELEITRQERERNPYHKNFLNNNIVNFSTVSLTFIISGILIMAYSYFVL